MRSDPDLIRAGDVVLRSGVIIVFLDGPGPAARSCSLPLSGRFESDMRGMRFENGAFKRHVYHLATRDAWKAIGWVLIEAGDP